MARPRHDLTLSTDTTAYLKQFDNKSKIVDEAIELHKNKDKLIMKEPDIPKGQIMRVLS